MAISKFRKLILYVARILFKTAIGIIIAVSVIIFIELYFRDHGMKISVLDLVAFLFFIYVNIYVHEFGHVAAAKSMKVGIQKVMIGSGRELIRTNLFGFPLIITGNIGGGFTFPSHIRGSLLKLRTLIFLTGGILIQALLTFVCILIRRFEPGAFNISEGFDLSNAFIISNLLMIGISLVPMKFRYRGIKIPNDGLRILRTLFLKGKSIIQEILVSGVISDAHEYYTRKEYEKAAEAYIKCIEQYPNEVIPKINLSATLIKSLKFEEAKKILVALNEENHNKQYDFLIYNNLAWVLLLHNDQASLVEADKFSKMAFDLNPDVPTVRGTRGCVLIEKGQIEEGINLLKRNVRLSKPIDEEMNGPLGFFFMAYAYYMKGRKDEARKYLIPLEGYENLDADDKYLFDLVITKTRNFDGV